MVLTFVNKRLIFLNRMTHLRRSITMKKIFIFLFTLLLILTSCSQVELESVVNTKTTSSVKILINNANSRTITPNRPNFNSFSISIVENVAESPKSTSKTVTSEEASAPIEFDNIKIGSYTVKVDAYDEHKTKVAYGEAQLNVQANSDNTVNVKLDYLSEGTGSFNVNISWKDLTNLANPFGEAIERNSLGFVAYDVENNCNLNGADITWLDPEQIQARRFNYSQSGIPATKGKVISFRIYTKLDGDSDIQCIAETFTTVIQIIPNLMSTPDLNEDENFKITNNRVNFYAKNVNPSTINVIYGEGEKAASEITVTWKYPKLSNGNYNGKLEVFLKDNNGTQIGNTQVFNYNQSKSEGSATFTGLSTSNTYSVYFYNESETGYSAVLKGASGIKTKVLVTGINFASEIPQNLTMGGYSEVLAHVLPSNATNSSYTLTVTDGAYVSGNKTVVFPSSGRYTVTATSDDNPNISVTSSEIVVNLATPVVRTSIVDDGFLIEWNEIAGATKYILTKTSNDPSNSSLITKELTTNSYTDTDQNYSGITYTYKVQAISADSALNSAVSQEASIALACPTITIELPNDFIKVSLQDALNAATGNNPYMTKSHSLSLNIQSPVEGITEYAWYLNGSLLVRGDYNAVKQYLISPENAYLDTSSVETSNTLMLTIVKDGYTYSATTYFKYIESDPGEIIFKLKSDTVVYNEPVTLSYSFENLVSTTPEIEWTSSDTNIATVDSNGQVTALRDGEFNITATIVSTGRSKTISMKTFIPISNIEFYELPTDYLIVPLSNGGVYIKDSKYASVDLKNYVKVTTADGTVYDCKNNWDKVQNRIEWSSPNNDYTLISSTVVTQNGIVTPNKDSNGGTAVINVKSKESDVSASKNINIRRYDVKFNGTTKTGKTVEVKWTFGKTHTLEVIASPSNEGISYQWSFDGDSISTSMGLEGTNLELVDSTNVKCTLKTHSNDYSKPTIGVIIYENSNPTCYVHFKRQ